MGKNILSFIACFLVSLILIQYRLSYPGIKSDIPLKVTTWDAFGYYMYLPSVFIYKDIKELSWLSSIDKKYSVSGGSIYQANKYKNGNYVFKYLGGVAILETPFFFLGHYIAKFTGFPADGFSPPYQHAIAFGALFYCILAIFLLRKILLRYFGDFTVALTLLLLLLATNFIQYASIDSAMSHAYIFPLYVFVLYTTIKWHDKPSLFWASLTGLIIGLATICRPTEAVMLFIPLLWNTHTKEASKEKWFLVRSHRSHVVFAVLFAFFAILPQLVYWKIVTGSWVYDVGSKWVFLNPYFRVLFGWEKGWFIYTPITLFFIIGLFFIRDFPFKKSVIWFCLLNIYIVISWHDWRYGGSYSTRALVQSYPVFALPLAAFIDKIKTYKGWSVLFYLLASYLLFVNLFQIKQYNNTILHYGGMTRLYYSSIYLNSNPTALDMSLLDTDEILRDKTGYDVDSIVSLDSLFRVKFTANATSALVEVPLERWSLTKDGWMEIKSDIRVEKGFYNSFLNAELQVADSIKYTKIRLCNPITPAGYANEYIFHMYVPEYFKKGKLKLYISSTADFDGVVEHLSVYGLKK